MPSGKPDRPRRPLTSRRLPAALVLLAWAAAAAGLEPTTERYRGQVGLIPVAAETRLEPAADGTWRYASVVRTRGWAAWKRGTLEETSQLRPDAEGLVPLVYRKRDGLGERDRDIETRFGAGEVVSRYRDETLRHPRAGPVYDLLTLRLVLQRDVAAGRLADRYPIVDGRGEVRTVVVRRVGTETIETGLGAVDAVRLEYVTRSERRYVLWFAPALDHALVRVEQHRADRLRGWLVLAEREAASAPSGAQPDARSGP